VSKIGFIEAPHVIDRGRSEQVCLERMSLYSGCPLRLFAFLLCTYTCSPAIADVPLTVTFQNMDEPGSSTMHISNVPFQQKHTVAIRSAEHWKRTVSAIDPSTLRLRSTLPMQTKCRLGAKLVSLGQLSIWRHGVPALQEAVLGPPPATYPLSFQFRPDAALGKLHGGESLSHSTFLHQQFEIEKEGSSLTPAVVTIRRAGEVLLESAPEVVNVHLAGALQRDEAADRAALEWVSSAVRKTCTQSFEGYPDDQKYFCSPQHDDRVYVRSRVKLPSGYVLPELVMRRQRETGMMKSQALNMPRLTRQGFTVARGPGKVMDKLHRWYLGNRLHLSKPEANGPLSTVISGYESDTWELNLGADLAAELDSAVRPMVATMLGLELTRLERSSDSLGMRIYHKGAVLHPHVDLAKTHPIGVVIHAGHLIFNRTSEVGEAWPFVITDHENTTHQVFTDKVGALVIYEAAKCFHWRKGAFRGREFANVFLHYKPKGWPEAYHSSYSAKEL